MKNREEVAQIGARFLRGVSTDLIKRTILTSFMMFAWAK